MPLNCSDGFRARTVALAQSGQAVTKAAEDLGANDSWLHGWVNRDWIVRAAVGGIPRLKSRKPRSTKPKIRELEHEGRSSWRVRNLLGSAASSACNQALSAKQKFMPSWSTSS